MRLLPVLMLAACVDKTGTLVIRAWAEDTVPDGLTTDDGWTVTFEHWYTGMLNVSLHDQESGDEIFSSGTSLVADWKGTAEPEQVAATDTDAGRYDIGFRVGPPAAGTTTLIGDAGGPIASEMTTNGWAHVIAASATDGAVTKTFRLGLSLDIGYETCENGYDGSQGVIVNKGDETVADIYMHADHLLWDQLGTEEAGLAFQAWADADADANGEITQAELEAVDLASIGYEAAGIDVDNLWQFVSFSVSVMAHLNGEGECIARAAE